MLYLRDVLRGSNAPGNRTPVYRTPCPSADSEETQNESNGNGQKFDEFCPHEDLQGK